MSKNLKLLDSRENCLFMVKAEYPDFRRLLQENITNFWVPAEVPLGETFQDYKKLNAIEKRAVDVSISLFATAELMVGNNLVLTLYDKITVPEIRSYLASQLYAEVIHSESFLYLADSLQMSTEKLYRAYLDENTIANIAELVNRKVSGLTPIQEFIHNIVCFYVIMESVNFYSAFAMLLSFSLKNKMKGLVKLIKFIVRDESNHIAGGLALLKALKQDYPEEFTPKFNLLIRDSIQEAVSHEYVFIDDVFRDEPLLNNVEKDAFKRYIEYVADRRLLRLGLEPVFNITECPLGFMSIQDGLQEENFFEGTPHEYTVGQDLQWD